MTHETWLAQEGAWLFDVALQRLGAASVRSAPATAALFRGTRRPVLSRALRQRDETLTPCLVVTGAGYLGPPAPTSIASSWRRALSSTSATLKLDGR